MWNLALPPEHCGVSNVVCNIVLWLTFTNIAMVRNLRKIRKLNKQKFCSQINQKFVHMYAVYEWIHKTKFSYFVIRLLVTFKTSNINIKIQFRSVTDRFLVPLRTLFQLQRLNVIAWYSGEKAIHLKQVVRANFSEFCWKYTERPR